MKVFRLVVELGLHETSSWQADRPLARDAITKQALAMAVGIGAPSFQIIGCGGDVVMTRQVREDEARPPCIAGSDWAPWTPSVLNPRQQRILDHLAEARRQYAASDPLGGILALIDAVESVVVAKE